MDRPDSARKASYSVNLRFLAAVASFLFFSAGVGYSQQSGTIVTVAGNGDSISGGGDGFAATSASVPHPRDVAVDAAGNLYITTSNRIRRVSPSGTIETFVILPIPTLYGYPITSQTWSTGLTIDGSGNLLVAQDSSIERRIIRVNQSGVATVLVTGAFGLNVGWHIGLAMDASGNLFIADPTNHRVVLRNSSGVLSLYAGRTGVGAFGGDGGLATAASLNTPRGVAVDTAGNLFIADSGNHRIRRVDRNGIITTFAGSGGPAGGSSGDGGLAVNAQLNTPLALAIDNLGNLYITDQGNSRIRRVNPQGIITAAAGSGSRTNCYGEECYSGDGGPAINAQLSGGAEGVEGISVDNEGNLYIADRFNHRVRKVFASGSSPCAAPSITSQPQGSSIASGQSATLSVTASGTDPLAYQWYQGNVDNTSSPVGTNSANYATPALASTTSYWVRITNACGSVDSTQATVTVTTTPGLLKPIVLIVPGIYGTKLISPRGTAWLGLGQILQSIVHWNQIAAFADLQYTADGKPVKTDVRPQDLMNLHNSLLSPWDSLDCTEAALATAMLTAPLGMPLDLLAPLKVLSYCRREANIYNSLVERLNKAGFETRTFPYDWRQSYGPTAANPNDNPAARLYEKVRELGTQSRPVAIVAHSMGGLVAGEMLRLNTQRGGELTPVLGPVITLGTPYDGSLEAYTALQGWGKLRVPEITTATSFETGKNWTAAYDLLPRWSFLRGGVNVEPFAVFRDGYGLLYPPLPRWPSIQEDVRTLWSKHDNRYSKAYSIVGTGTLTPTYLFTQSYDVILINGDKTVPLRSAQAADWVPPENFFYVKEEHTALPRNAAVLNAVESILSPGAPSPNLSKEPVAAPEVIKIRVSGTVGSQGGKGVRSDTTSVGANCPLNLTASDGTDRTVGDGVDNLEGAGTLSFGCEMLLWLPKGSRYSVEVMGGSVGQADITVETTSTDQNSWQELGFRGIPTTGQSKGSLTIGADGGVSSLQYDATGSGNSQNLTPAVIDSGAVPRFTSAGVTNPASYVSEAVVPGAIATLFGSGLTKGVLGIVQASSIPLPTELSGTSVLIDGHLAPLFAVAKVNGGEQVNFQVPWEVAGRESVSIVVSNQGFSGPAVRVNLSPAQPGVFAYGENAGVIVHGTDNQLVTASNPARPQEVVVIYSTGLGSVSPTPLTGGGSPSVEPLSRTTALPTVTIGGRNAEVQFSGLTPGFVGLYQINTKIPADLGSGDLDVVVAVSGQTSKAVKLALAGNVSPSTVSRAK